MQSLTQLFILLRSVRSLRFDARSRGATGWNGVGAGTVAVSEPAAGVVVFEEAGTWQPDGGESLRFTNVFRWSARGQTLRLEHLRLGPDHPVFLFDMAAAEDGGWRSVDPHQCGDDCYAASLAIDGRQLVVTWSIDGPRKQESIRYTYW